MKAWCFFGEQGRRAFTIDETGSNLPVEFAPWTKFKIVMIHKDDAEFEAADTAIKSDGYYLVVKPDA